MDKNALLIGIAGGTGSGKTSVAKAIAADFGKFEVALIEQDSYYQDLSDLTLEERSAINFDHPDSLDYKLMNEHLNELIHGNPIDIPILLEKYLSHHNTFLVGGIRTKRKDSLIKIISSKIANKIRSLILKDDCIDTGCSLKVFDRDIFLSFPFFDGIHRFLPALFKGYGYKTMYVAVDHRERKFGISKYGTINRLIRGIIDIIKVLNIIKNHKNNN